MYETMGPTAREGVLASLLLHACLFIVVLLFPNLFTVEGKPEVARDPNEPIPLAFLEEIEEPPDLASILGDAGKEERSDPRPESAPAENDDPYAVGNNPNRFVAPPMPERVPASPQPGQAVAEGQPSEGAESLPGEIETAERERDGEGADGEPADGTEDPQEVADAGDLLVPPAGSKDGSRRSDRSKEGLREAIGRMSTGLSGEGAPLRFHNPVGALSGPVGGLSFDTPGFDWGPYARRIYWIIFNNWVNGWPPAARAGLAGVVTVRFRIHRDGTLDAIQVLAPSGTPAFDTAATLALEASNPLPPLPADFPKESEGVTGRFIYNMNLP